MPYKDYHSGKGVLGDKEKIGVLLLVKVLEVVYKQCK